MTRRYELKRRAERQEETRQRIIDATVGLHQEIGPARTTISAIARRAGVERQTVYRHFPRESDLFAACSQQFITDHPLPDPATWAAIADPVLRLRTVLIAVYAHHRQTEPMQANVARDAPRLPALQAVIAPATAYWRAVRAILLAGWTVAEERSTRLAAAIDLALAFPTWHLLTHQHDLTDEQAAAIMVDLVACEAGRDGYALQRTTAEQSVASQGDGSSSGSD